MSTSEITKFRMESLFYRWLCFVNDQFREASWWSKYWFTDLTPINVWFALIRFELENQNFRFINFHMLLLFMVPGLVSYVFCMFVADRCFVEPMIKVPKNNKKHNRQLRYFRNPIPGKAKFGKSFGRYGRTWCSLKPTNWTEYWLHYKKYGTPLVKKNFDSKEFISNEHCVTGLEIIFKLFISLSKAAYNGLISMSYVLMVIWLVCPTQAEAINFTVDSSAICDIVEYIWVVICMLTMLGIMWHSCFKTMYKGTVISSLQTTLEGDNKYNTQNDGSMHALQSKIISLWFESYNSPTTLIKVSNSLTAKELHHFLQQKTGMLIRKISHKSRKVIFPVERYENLTLQEIGIVDTDHIVVGGRLNGAGDEKILAKFWTKVANEFGWSHIQTLKNAEKHVNFVTIVGIQETDSRTWKDVFGIGSMQIGHILNILDETISEFNSSFENVNHYNNTDNNNEHKEEEKEEKKPKKFKTNIKKPKKFKTNIKKPKKFK
eukprot:258873_1